MLLRFFQQLLQPLFPPKTARPGTDSYPHPVLAHPIHLHHILVHQRGNHLGEQFIPRPPMIAADVRQQPWLPRPPAHYPAKRGAPLPPSPYPPPRPPPPSAPTLPPPHT